MRRLPHPSFSPSTFSKKAQEINLLSQRVSQYLMPEMAGLRDDGTEEEKIYLTGDIVRHSHSLLPKIVKAETGAFSEDRHRYAVAVSKHAKRLYRACERLGKVNSNGRDFALLLQTELKKFRKLEHVWVLTL
ncbi:MAG: hypothetical protein ACPG7E_04345 [Marinirhabdus sp.]